MLASNPPHSRVFAWTGSVVGFVLPTLVTLAYFVFGPRFDTDTKQAIYVVMKSAQFLFPILWVWAVLRDPIRPWRPSWNGIGLGVLFGLAVASAGWVLYVALLRGTPMFSDSVEIVRDRVQAFGVDRPWKYALLGVFYSLIHSSLEEYYFRWFLFGQFRRLLPLWPAILISAVGFMMHHVIILGTYFEWAPLPTAFFSLCVAVGGVFWAWLYDRSGSIAGPCISHLLIDAGIFLVGFDMMRGLWAG